MTESEKNVGMAVALNTSIGTAILFSGPHYGFFSIIILGIMQIYTKLLFISNQHVS